MGAPLIALLTTTAVPRCDRSYISSALNIDEPLSLRIAPARDAMPGGSAVLSYPWLDSFLRGWCVVPGDM